MVYRKLTSKSSDLRANNKVEKEKSGGTREKVSQRLRFESQEKKSVIERKKNVQAKLIDEMYMKTSGNTLKNKPLTHRNISEIRW